MCGLSGIIYKDLNCKDSQRFKNAANLSKHRGPDFTGYFEENDIEMVHHRLSILDLDERSHQPFIGNSDNSPVLIYNGEIYNYRDLALKYSLKLNTSSDTEVLYQLLQDQSFDLKELNGIFAFALYDKRQKLIRITRDRLGVKPLYYYDCDEYFIFSSEAKVIYSYLEALKINYKALSEYLTFGNTISAQTVVDGVKKLDPGSSLIIKLSDYSLIEEKYWNVEKNLLKKQINPSYSEALKTTRELLQNAVERQCVSDVQVGAYLSGGIDSSAVVALASKFTEKKLNTYSVNFDKNPNSELKLASKLAGKYDTNHHEFEVNTENIDEYLSDLVFQYDEPFADPAMIPLHLIADKASDFSKVVLQGDGGDEIFAGYGRHLDLQQYH
ncbi:asparagine synthase (glutamine-hydrolyzing) [Rhodohalobacter sp.]|uniref:asparagine synthase (glutamine-hydrolyzing) n=1 Tax=Rhodohalobacter sp. TaxID=1974210 RepID=UPI002ACDBFA2|nr:asparagine synthase (glutamine-hydrolyzing) [Rhodohalobacter sp.]MDZ7755206.1 asparagine synthase (glutamine-hydrolyzing) [Rhodohalobacter sp.]